MRLIVHNELEATTQRYLTCTHVPIHPLNAALDFLNVMSGRMASAASGDTEGRHNDDDQCTHWLERVPADSAARPIPEHLLSANVAVNRAWYGLSSA